MKKCNRIILPISVISFSFALISLNHALATYMNTASNINIGISGVTPSYYLEWNSGEKETLASDGSTTQYSKTVNISETGSYSYKIVDINNNEIFSQSSFDVGLTGDFSISFDSETKKSSITYSFSVLDHGKAFGEGMYCYASENNPAAVGHMIIGSFCNWSLGSSSAVQMSNNPNNSDDKGMARHVYLANGNTFKLVDSNGTYYGYSKLKSANGFDDFGNCFSGDTKSDSNITVTKSGYYDFCYASDGNLYVSKSDEAEYIQGSRNADGITTTFTLDATKYASSNTYLSFYGNETAKHSGAVDITYLFSSKTNAECLMMTDIYLNPGKWNTASAWFMAGVGSTNSSKTNYVKMVQNGDTYYSMSLPTSDAYADFYRMNSEYDKSGPIYNDPSYKWNMVNSLSDNTAIDIANYSCFSIIENSDGSWTENDCSITSLPTGFPQYSPIPYIN